MSGVHVTNIKKINDGARLIVDWTYDGCLKPKVEPIYCEPSPRQTEDIVNFVLSIFLPLLVAVDEEIVFSKPWSIQKDSISFWDQKIDSELYKNNPRVRVSPVKDYVVSKRVTGEKTALLWGGGADSALIAADLVDKGIEPILVHVQRDEPGWTPDGMFQKCHKEMGRVLGLDTIVVKTNALDVQRNFWNSAAPYLNHDNPWNWGCVLAPNQRRFTGQMSSGAVYFFTAISVMPDEVKEVIMGGATDDPWEPYGYGMDFWNNTTYRGIKLRGMCLATKVEEYGILYRKYPEVAQWIKPCWDDRVQWCGQCKKCREAALMLKANQLPAPFKLLPGESKTGGMFKVGRLLATLYHYRKFPNREYAVEREISEAVYESCKILASRAG